MYFNREFARIVANLFKHEAQVQNALGVKVRYTEKQVQRTDCAIIAETNFPTF